MKNIIILVLVITLIGGLVWSINSFGLISPKNSSSNPAVSLIKKAGVLKVGSDATFNPMEYLDKDGNVVGFGSDLAKEIAKEYGVPVEIKNIVWDNIFSELDKGNIDLIISSVTITTERSKTLSFSKPYFSSGQVIVVLKTDTSIKDLNSLHGKKLGVQTDTTSQTEASKLTDKDKVIAFADYDLATTDLLSGKIDALIMDYPPAAAKVKSNSRLKLVGGPFTQEFYGVVAAKGHEDILQPVNTVIEKLITNGALKKMEDKWLK
jgi:ABC-type amino acid transport substrate-binding protein